MLEQRGCIYPQIIAPALLPVLRQVEGLRHADHSPGVLLLDAINERLAGEGQNS